MTMRAGAPAQPAPSAEAPPTAGLAVESAAVESAAVEAATRGPSLPLDPAVTPPSVGLSQPATPEAAERGEPGGEPGDLAQAPRGEEASAGMVRVLPRTRRFLAAATWRRALAETVALAVAVVVLTPFYPGRNTWTTVQIAAMLLLGPAGCALWLALRLRLPSGPLWRGLLIDVGAGVSLALLPSAILALLLRRVIIQSPQGAARDIIGGMIVAAIFAIAFVVYRVAVRLWLWWDTLRRRSLQWALTHALLSVAAGGAALVGFALLGVVVALNRPSAALFQWITALVLVVAVVVCIILFVLPPSALFSYLFARGASRRIRRLAEATARLRAGDYTTRTVVEGEDEVAQLQANFNVMAADLERGVHDLRAERDNVGRLLEQRREMIANVSHELRTPVATLRGYLESATLRWDEAAPETLRRDAEVMLHETERLQHLIDDLFTLAQADVRRLDLRREAVDVSALARRAVATVAPLAWSTARVEVVARVAGALPLALGDPDRIEQALHNLLRNALRHTPPGGIIVVAVERAAPAAASGASAGQAVSERLALSVRDTGTGIALQDLAHIWERFYRAEQTRVMDATGAGLGLALVKELIEAMGGAVTAESEVGQGSVFTLCLPVAEAEVRPGALAI